jgi:hypothetical protein
VPETNYLRPPAIEKNFLISPPGSPPIGWEPIKEDPPNATPLADDLMTALRKLKTHERRSSLEVLLDPHEGSGVSVYVEDCGMDDDEEIGACEGQVETNCYGFATNACDHRVIDVVLPCESVVCHHLCPMSLFPG